MIKKDLISKIKSKLKEFNDDRYTYERLIEGLSEHLTYERFVKELTLKSLSLVSVKEPNWTYIAARTYLIDLIHNVEKRRGYKYGDIKALVRNLSKSSLYGKNIYGEYINDNYTDEELNEVSKIIKIERDDLFDYAGLTLLSERYLAQNSKREIMELPQERFIIIALHLALAERSKEDRLRFIKDLYYNLSTLKATMATPTLSNAGKPHYQLSSCNVLTMSDDLESIARNNEAMMQLSKHGAGIGVYIGKIRSRGASIRGFKNASNGVIPWIKIINDIAISCNQLG